MFMIAINWFFLEVPPVNTNQTTIEDSRQQQPEGNKSPEEKLAKIEKVGDAEKVANSSAQEKPNSEPSESSGNFSRDGKARRRKTRRVRVPST
jgi:hypothetical protein